MGIFTISVVFYFDHIKMLNIKYYLISLCKTNNPKFYEIYPFVNCCSDSDVFFL